VQGGEQQMKKVLFNIGFCFSIVILLVSMTLSLSVYAENVHHNPITLKLINLLKDHPEIKTMLERSLAEAKKINPDPETNPAQSLPELFNYLDQAVEKLPDTHIGSDIHYLTFLADQPLPELKGKGLFKNSLQYYPPFASWMREFAIARGEFLNSEKSWNAKIYREFYNDPRFGLQKNWYEDPSNWKTWNQFFARYLRSPEARPIASPDDPSVVIAPADSIPQGVWKIDEDSKIKAENGLKVKNDTYFSIEDLLGKDSNYKNAFAGGILTHSYLSPFDYHRYHFAVGGIVKEKKIIPGNVACPSKWNAEKETYDAVDLMGLGWQFTQTRGYVIVDTREYGLVALIPVGMDLVSSVNFEEKVKEGATFKKGDMLGTFLFGGSDFIMLFQEKAKFEITAPKEGSMYKHLLMGERYGVLKGLNESSSARTTYEGILPCADCEGLKTELTLDQDFTYNLKETYLATRDGDKTFTSSGKWRKIKDGKGDLIQLNYDNSQKLYNFRVLDENHLKVVDNQGNDIECPFNLVLTKK